MKTEPKILSAEILTVRDIAIRLKDMGVEGNLRISDMVIPVGSPLYYQVQDKRVYVDYLSNKSTFI